MPSNMQQISGSHSGDFLRLARLLVWQRHFNFIFAAVDNPQYRDELIHRLTPSTQNDESTSVSTRFEVVNVSEQASIRSTDDPLILIHHCVAAHKIGATRLHLCFELDQNMPPLWWQQVNLLRERIADAFPQTFIFWMSDSQITLAASQAPDLWNWRSAVFNFTAQILEKDNKPQLNAAEFTSIANVNAADADLRLQEIEAYLVQNSAASSAYLQLEAAEILERLGEWDKALRYAEAAVRKFDHDDNDMFKAVTKGKIADIFQARGRLDEALAIRQNDELPVYQQLGDVREAAVTKGKIADIFQARGRLDEALAIRQNEQLPIFEQLGDVRSAAVTKGKIADIFEARGRLDEALAIRQYDELPVYEQLGDVRSAAVTKGKIADIFQARGRLDEALAIRQNDELPVYQQLGDVREAAVAKTKIADIYAAQNRMTEALAIWRNDVLPIFKAMGYINEVQAIEARIASVADT
jgi:tetratricopeptide (TPR) repeat protein